MVTRTLPLSLTPGTPPVLLAALLSAALALPTAVAAQRASQGTTGATQPSAIIQRIELNREAVFDSTEARRHWLARVANSLHVLTRRSTIEHEMLLRPGSRYDTVLAVETAQNLRNMGIFSRVRVDSVRAADGLVARVTTRDAWSTTADLRFRGSGEQLDYQVTLDDENLLGTGTRIGARYRKTPDRSWRTVTLSRRRLIARRIGADVRFDFRSDGERQQVGITQPLFSVRSRFGFEFRAERSDERVLRFRGGEVEASDTLWREYRIGRADVTTAIRSGSGGYLRLGLTALLRRDDYARSQSGPFGRDVVATGGPFLEWRRADYLSAPRFIGLGRDEEVVDLGSSVRFGVLAAPAIFGYAANGIGGLALVHHGMRMPRGFAMLDAAANGRFTKAGLDSGSVFVAGTMALKPFRDHLLLVHARAGWIEAPRPGTEYDYGLVEGPRAYRTHAFTGDRAVFMTGEYRVILPRAVLGLANVGVAAFGDYGGAWFAGSPSRYGSSVGVGMRWGINRSAGLSPSRLDLAYRGATEVLPGGWVISVGRGLTISTSPR